MAQRQEAEVDENDADVQVSDQDQGAEDVRPGDDSEPTSDDIDGGDEDDDIVGDETGRPRLRPDRLPAPEGQPLRVPSGAGEPLARDVRSHMERAIGTDFGSVRVHTDEAATHAAKQLGAEAFTIGSDIYFDRYYFSPSTTTGRQLMAHELVHVAQQSGPGGEAPRVRRRRRRKRRTSPSAGPAQCRPAGRCTGPCAPSCAELHRTGCHTGDPPDTSNFLRHLEVERGAHRVTATWGADDRSVPATRTETWKCSPSTRSGKGGKVPTPLVSTTVSMKCDGCYTNSHGDGMGWFTNFASHRSIGFHNSQHVGPSYESHGCVRVFCDVAQIINAQTWSGHTTIHVVP
jgi:hypothetical protein